MPNIFLPICIVFVACTLVWNCLRHRGFPFRGERIVLRDFVASARSETNCTKLNFQKEFFRSSSVCYSLQRREGTTRYPNDNNRLQHIDVCICTYKRQELLQRLLEALQTQETEARFTYSILVVDNDSLRSAESVVAMFSAAGISIKYCVQEQQNIARTRNMAVTHAEGNFIAFIDDDEVPIPTWLLTLFKACESYRVDGVLGPVKPYFDQAPPAWVINAKLYERPTYPTGLVIDSKKGRTGNVLLRRAIFLSDEVPFRPEFRVGEDQDFFGRMIARGHVFIWCNEAIAYELVPPSRWNYKFLVKRALLRGASSFLHASSRRRRLVNSLFAVPLYIVLLPVALLFGYHRFIVLLISLFDHLGKILAALGLDPIRTQYVTE